MSKHEAVSQRLVINLLTREVWLERHRFEVNHSIALQVFQRIAAAKGKMVSRRVLQRIPGCSSGEKRFDRVLSHLPAPLRRFVIGTRGMGGGYAIKLPPLEESPNVP